MGITGWGWSYPGSNRHFISEIKKPEDYTGFIPKVRRVIALKSIRARPLLQY